MKVLILAAGYGTRLYAVTKDTPKALLEINNKPLINHILDRLKSINDIKEVIVVTNNKFDSCFQEWADVQTEFSFKIKIINDGTNSPEDRLGSIGDINFVLDNYDVADDLLVVGGDNLFDYNIDEYISFSKSVSDFVTIGLYDIESIDDATKFGVVAVDENKKIISFEEKPEKPKSSLIAMCFYYLPKDSLDLVGKYLNESEKSDKAGDYIKWLYEKNEVYGFKFTGKWYDIGSVEDLKEAQEKFIS